MMVLSTGNRGVPAYAGMTVGVRGNDGRKGGKDGNRAGEMGKKAALPRNRGKGGIGVF